MTDTSPHSEGVSSGSGKSGPTLGHDRWREYELLVDLYKFYLGLIIQGTGGYFVIVGGILTLVLANVRDQPMIAFALVVPILLSVLLAIANWAARRQVSELSVATQELVGELEVMLGPHTQILGWAVAWSFWLLVVAAGLLIVLLIWLTLPA
jgi:hypothetical protein